MWDIRLKRRVRFGREGIEIDLGKIGLQSSVLNSTKLL